MPYNLARSEGKEENYHASQRGEDDIVFQIMFFTVETLHGNVLLLHICSRKTLQCNVSTGEL